MTDKKILKAHGGGGTAMSDLIESHLLSVFKDPRLLKTDDAAVWKEKIVEGDKLAMTTDAYVVAPIFFPGGDIGKLAISGTVNDLAVKGARPIALSLALILEEGFSTDSLDKIMNSISETANEAKVSVVTGDTKVVERGAGNGCYIVTAGIGIVPKDRETDIELIRPGDAIIINSFIGDHGTAVMAARNGFELGEEIVSDAAPLSELIEIFFEFSPDTRFIRDATRGGISNLLCEVAAKTSFGIELVEDSIPIRSGTRAALSMLGLDPLGVANEGVIVAFLPAEKKEAVLNAMRRHRYGSAAQCIGTVTEKNKGRVILKTSIGGERILVRPYGEELPRIC